MQEQININRNKYIMAIGIGCVLSFLVGFFFGKIHLGRNKPDVWFIEEQNNARNNYGWNLTKEDAEFLKEHVLGEWRFSQLLDGSLGQDFGTWEGDGMENLQIVFDENYTKIKGYHQETFPNTEDAYIFTEIMNDIEVNFPVYHIVYDADFYTDYDFLTQVFRKGMDSNVAFSGEGALKVIYFNLGYDTYLNPNVGTWHEEHLIYVNPYDKDKLYFRFCGLWELDRVVPEGSWKLL